MEGCTGWDAEEDDSWQRQPEKVEEANGRLGEGKGEAGRRQNGRMDGWLDGWEDRPESTED